VLLILSAKLYDGCGFGLSLSPWLWSSFLLRKYKEGEALSMNINEARKKYRKKMPCDSISYTTGDINLNINRFNQAMGSLEGHEAGVGGEGALAESKRYVRRYLAKPMNKFCSNKAEILKLLVDIGDQNCTIYTLNNLEDNEKDINKLTNNDIIYTYDDGILKDKNGIRVLDYDLSVKKEENRKKLSNPDPNSKEFRDVYEDRMTSATELEENFDEELLATCPYDVISADYNNIGDEFIISLNHNVTDIDVAAEELIAWAEEVYGISVLDWNTNGSNVFIFELQPDNAFDLDFDSVNVYGERLTEAKENFCCICGEDVEGNGYDPEPYKSTGRCCKGCHLKFVAPLTVED
jgi:hypothetical protein